MNPAFFIEQDKFFLHYEKVPGIILGHVNSEIDLAGSVIMDFGCDLGVKTLGIASKSNAKLVVGVDIQDNFRNLGLLSEKFLNAAPPDNLQFVRINPGESVADRYKPDCIYSWSVFEHIKEPLVRTIAADLHHTLKDDGLFFVQVNPLYHSPFGSHLSHVIKEPWAHLLYTEARLEDTLFNIPDLSDEMKRELWMCFKSLNRLGLDDFLAIFKAAGFTVADFLCGKSKLSPPASLLATYPEQDLLTEGFRLLLRKS